MKTPGRIRVQEILLREKRSLGRSGKIKYLDSAEFVDGTIVVIYESRNHVPITGVMKVMAERRMVMVRPDGSLFGGLAVDTWWEKNGE